MVKRKSSPSPDTLGSPPPAKAVKLESSTREWPAPPDALKRAEEFVRGCVAPTPHKVLLVPDKDADGLSATLVLYRTLIALGLPASNITLHFLAKGANIHSDKEREKMEESGAARVIVLDQGSRPGPPIVTKEGMETLIIDHHFSHEHPDKATILTACHSPPISTTSLLAYCLCTTILPSLKSELGWVALIGVYGDLGSSTVKFGQDGWGCAELVGVEKEYKKKSISDAVSLLNAPRRSPQFDVPTAWNALLKATRPSDVSNSDALHNARQRVNAEVTRCQAYGPKFSKDGTLALVRIRSDAQVHPVIATRWAGTLKSAKKLVCVMCANEGYTEGKTHFSARIANHLRKLDDDERPDLISLLKRFGAQADELSPGWKERVGEDFARGHKEATGGIIANAEFETLCEAMEIGIKDENGSPKKGGKKVIDPGQKNTLDSFFGVKPKVEGKKE